MSPKVCMRRNGSHGERNQFPFHSTYSFPSVKFHIASTYTNAHNNEGLLSFHWCACTHRHTQTLAQTHTTCNAQCTVERTMHRSTHAQAHTCVYMHTQTLGAHTHIGCTHVHRHMHVHTHTYACTQEHSPSASHSPLLRMGWAMVPGGGHHV